MNDDEPMMSLNVLRILIRRRRPIKIIDRLVQARSDPNADGISVLVRQYYNADNDYDPG